MKLDIYQIDAFANRAFEGNPAAVCPLDIWLPDELMQSIASENNLSETAFFVPEGDGYSIRWFTPTAEVDLCGHATLASAFVLFNILNYDGDKLDFDSRSGYLSVSRDGDYLVMDFPSLPLESCDTPNEIVEAFEIAPIECLKAEDYVVIFENAEQVLTASPNFEILKNLDCRGVIISAASDEYDFVARFFAPNLGIPEDPVTGSVYTLLAPYWAKKTNKSKFHAKQVSSRGGEVWCELKGDRVLISGRAVKYLEGSVEVET
ncbi:MAG: isomerase [Gammaproteobacteria bacterium]|nr:MAG: isomerase [Gammaproteobacteria bacterium]HHH75974.1 PhzF family phenazine biosynthesis protein [Phycisphaerae bacterium]